MRALDTNVLVRYLTRDDPKQAAIAVAEIEGAAERDERMLIQPVVLCELASVLATAYEFGKAEILAVLDQFVRTRQFEFADQDTVWSALADYRHGRAVFSDYYLGRADERDGASQTLTFDRALKRSPRFRVLSA